MSDLISRQAAIDAIAEAVYYEQNMDGKMQAFDLADWKWHFRNVLSCLPSAQPERKRGKDDSNIKP